MVVDIAVLIQVALPRGYDGKAEGDSIICALGVLPTMDEANRKRRIGVESVVS